MMPGLRKPATLRQISITIKEIQNGDQNGSQKCIMSYMFASDLTRRLIDVSKSLFSMPWIHLWYFWVAIIITIRDIQDDIQTGGQSDSQKSIMPDIFDSN